MPFKPNWVLYHVVFVNSAQQNIVKCAQSEPPSGKNHTKSLEAIAPIPIFA